MTDYTAKARELAKTLRQLRVLRPMPEDEDNLIAAAMREAVEAEREACAKIFDDMAHAHELNYTAANAEGLRGEAEAEGARVWQRRRDAERLRARGEVAK